MSDAIFPADKRTVVEGWSAVEATGPDAGKFLQAFCTNDVLKLADNGSCEAMFTDVKAHAIAYGWVVRHAEDAYTVLLASDRAETLREHLDRYLIREKVELTAVTGAVTIGHGLSGWPIDAFGAGVTAVYGETIETETANRLNTDEFERLRIRLGIPFDGRDVTDRNLPQEVDRNNQTISFTKGCYLGQEPVARIDARGRVNWRLRGLAVEGPAPATGAEVTADGKAIGRVTSAVAADGGSLAMAYVRSSHSSAGTEVSVESSPAVISDFPIAISL